MRRTRTFIGFALPRDMVAKVAALQDELRKAHPGVHWVEPANIHLTLLFLGDLDDRELVDVCRVVDRIAAKEEPIGIALSGVGAFPTPRRPKTLWAGVSIGADDVLDLHSKVEGALVEKKLYVRDVRGFVPHVTLGRVQNDEASQAIAPLLPALETWEGGKALLSEAIVYRSDLRRDGPEYTVMGRGSLRG